MTEIILIDGPYEGVKIPVEPDQDFIDTHILVNGGLVIYRRIDADSFEYAPELKMCNECDHPYSQELLLTVHDAMPHWGGKFCSDKCYTDSLQPRKDNGNS